MLIKVRVGEGRAGPGLVDKSEGWGARLAEGLSIKARGWGRAGQPIEVRGFGVTGPGPAGPPSLANPHVSRLHI